MIFSITTTSYSEAVVNVGYNELNFTLASAVRNCQLTHVASSSVGLPSIWVLAVVSIGGNLLGVVGMIVFIPIVSVIYALFREYVYLMLKKQKSKR